ncbi:ribonuclease H-like domain-containing protein [Tanacetum coccineum]
MTRVSRGQSALFPCFSSVYFLYKARLVANRRSQQFGIDYDDTFSPVVKPATIRIVLSLSLSRGWHVHQLDVKNSFLNEDLSETVYMYQPPVDTESKLGCDWDPVSDPSLYRSLVGGLQYLTFTRPDISYAVQQICLFIHDPREPHLAVLKHTQCYVQDNLLSWSTKHQHTVSRSSVEAEYKGVANVVAETAWLHNLLRELHSPLHSDTLVYCDNVSAIYFTANPIQHQRTKHIAIDIFFRDMVSRGQVYVLHVPSRYQYANIFTKDLPSALFEEFRTSLSAQRPPALTAGKC